MIKTCIAAAFAAVLFIVIAVTSPASTPAQDELEAFKNNSCVECHSKDLKSSELTNRYLEWHLSRHMQAAVGCEKCHGGDPTTDRKEKSHAGVLKAADATSRVNPLNLPATCGECHKPIVAAFTGSVHFQKLKAAGMGPSCSTCHQHMASIVASSPPDAALLCAQCHEVDRAVQPKRPEIPAQAQAVMEAIDRANGIVVWTDGLLGAAKERKLNVTAEEANLTSVRAMLSESKAKWHDFTLVGVRESADAAFTKGVGVKDELRKKLGFK